MNPLPSPPHASDPAAAKRRGDLFYLIPLLLGVILLRGWLLCNTEVAARDSIGYIRYALQFEQKSWAEVVRGNEQHPGYPFCLWLVSQPVRAIWGTDPDTMRLCSQLVTSVCAVLLVFPMFYLGKRLFDAQVGFWAALAFQVLPVSGHHLSDGISDGLFWLLAASALLLGVRAAQEGRWRDYVLCGMLSGLAYLTRPEGLFLAAALAVTLAGMQLVPATRRGWGRWLGQEACLAGATLAVASVYIAATGGLTNKLSSKLIWRGEVVRVKGSEILAGDMGLQANVMGAFFQSSPHFGTRLTRSLGALGQELVQGLHYLGIVPALVGLLWNWRRLLRNPGFWMVMVYFGLQAGALLALATTVSYVSDRHVSVLVLCGCIFLAAGLRDLGGVVVNLAGRWRPTLTWRPATMGVIMGLALLAYCLPKTLGRVHGNRQGNHAAGLWLAQRVQAGDQVDDDHCWAHYYAGLVFREGKDASLPQGIEPTCYVVMTRSKDAEIDRRRRETEDKLRQDQARLVYHWPERVDADKARVVIYAMPRDARRQP